MRADFLKGYKKASLNKHNYVVLTEGNTMCKGQGWKEYGISEAVMECY